MEDTDTTFEEIEGIFGSEVMKLVEEVTDDKSLPKHERKRLQIEHAPGTRCSIPLRVEPVFACNKLRITLSRFNSTWRICSREQRKKQLDWFD